MKDKMKFHKIIIFKFFLFTILLYYVWHFHPVLAQQNNWLKKISSQFVIFFQSADQKNANKILQTIDQTFPQISQQLNISFLDSVTIILSPSEKSYSQFVGKNFPNWSGGAASPDQNLIILKSPSFTHEERNNAKITIHELTHILLNKAVNKNPLPRWFNEGMAVYFSGEKEFASNSLISKALITKSIIPLREIDKVLNFHQDKAQLAYQESFLAVSYLIEKFGNESMKIILAQLAQGNDMDAALVHAIGSDQTDFEYEWYHSIQKKYRWHFLLDFDIYLWIFILLLFIFGFLIIRKRNRLTMKRWEQEDETDGLW